MAFFDFRHAARNGAVGGRKPFHALHLFMLLGLLIPALFLTGCFEDKDKKEQTSQETVAPVQTAEPEIKPEPLILVGGVGISMPAPQGFERIDISAPLASRAQVAMDNDEMLLGLFARTGQKDDSAESPAEGSGAPEPAAAAIDDSGIITVTTLKKWANSSFTSASFEELKAAWQKESLRCDQEVLENFIEAANSRLADYSSYSYNLGMAGFSAQQISFARIEKNTPTDGGAVFKCSLNTLLFRNGKILRLHYVQRINNFAEIAPTIAAYMDYLQELQLANGSISEDLGRQTMRIHPPAGAEVSIAPAGLSGK